MVVEHKMVTINTTDDLLRLLDENPEFREAVRSAILTQELMRFRRRSALSPPRCVRSSLKCANSSLKSGLN